MHRDAGLQCVVQHGAIEALCTLVALPSHTAAVMRLVPPVLVAVRPSDLHTRISVMSIRSTALLREEW